MSETRFTPGPWAIDPKVHVSAGHGEFDIIAPDGDDDPWNIARTFGGIGEDGESEPKANAHLIAAAPELYEALENVLSDIVDYERANNLSPAPGREDCWQSVTNARAALAKAAGRTE